MIFIVRFFVVYHFSFPSLGSSILSWGRDTKPLIFCMDKLLTLANTIANKKAENCPNLFYSLFSTLTCALVPPT